MLAALLLSAFAVAQPPPQVLAGTWNVTQTVTADACAGRPGTVLASSWLVSVGPDGSVSIMVQGQTRYPSLTGIVTLDGQLTLSGTSGPAAVLGAQFVPVTYLNVTVAADGTLTGERVTVETRPSGNLLYGCFVKMTVVGRKA